MKTKVSYYLSHPIQYFSPLLREMDRAFDLRVYYFSDPGTRGNRDAGFGREVRWDIPLLEAYSYRFLKNISRRKSLSNRLWDVINPSVLGTLKKSDANIIIVNGWSYFSELLTIAWAKLLGKQVWLRAENPLNQELKKSRRTLWLKKVIFQKLLFPLVSKFLYIGTESKLFFEYYGVKPDRLVYTPYAVDNDRFRAAQAAPGNKEQLREELGLPQDKRVILFCGKFIEKKRPMDLLKAYHLLDDDSVCLVMVGEGVLRKQMECYVQEHQLQDVVFPGFINQSAVARYYASADIFVMCSGMGETWGLAVNEAMNFSLPVIVSKTCGCSRDLVQEKRNGYVFEEGDVAALSGCIKKLTSDEALCLQYGSASREIIDDYSIKHIVQNLVEAVG